MTINKLHLGVSILLSISFVIGAFLISQWRYSKYDVEIEPEIAKYTRMPSVTASPKGESSPMSSVMHKTSKSPRAVNTEGDSMDRELRDDVHYATGTSVTLTADGRFLDSSGREITDSLSLYREVTGNDDDPRLSLIDTYNELYGSGGVEVADTFSDFFRSLSYHEMIEYVGLMGTDGEAPFRQARGFYFPHEKVDKGY